MHLRLPQPLVATSSTVARTLLGAAAAIVFSLLVPDPAHAQFLPAEGDTLNAGCPATVTWLPGAEGAPEFVNILFIATSGDTVAVLAADAVNDGTEDLTIACTAAGVFHGRVEVYAGTELIFIGADVTLISAAPVIAQPIVGGAESDTCSGSIEFSTTITDDCGLTAGDVTVGVELVDDNATLGEPVITITDTGSGIAVTGSADVTDVTEGVAVVRVTITATDNCGFVTQVVFDTELGDSEPPVIVCPADIVVECSELGGTPADDPAIVAFLAAATATDNCDPDPSISSDAPDFFELGITVVTFIATDAGGNADSCTATVEVIDTIPPEITIVLNRDFLWPPNHKFHDIVADVTVTDLCDPEPTYALESITSDESPNGRGDGNTQPDIHGADLGEADTMFELRAERAGGGDGRLYTIVYRASDSSGNMASDTAWVLVPHDRSGKARASNGFDGLGRALDPDDERFALIVPSWTDAGTGEVFDATAIDLRRAQIGNLKGVVSPDEIYLGDVHGDALRDVVLVYPREFTEQLDRLGRGQLAKMSLHYVGPRGEHWVVHDIFALGAPTRVDLATLERWEDEASDGGSDGGDPVASPERALTTMLMAQPNPFRPLTSVRFRVLEDGPVDLRVFDVAGRPVRVLASGFRTAGDYAAAWDGMNRKGSRMTPGVYFLRLDQRAGSATTKIVMLE